MFVLYFYTMKAKEQNKTKNPRVFWYKFRFITSIIMLITIFTIPFVLNLTSPEVVQNFENFQFWALFFAAVVSVFLLRNWKPELPLGIKIAKTVMFMIVYTFIVILFFLPFFPFLAEDTNTLLQNQIYVGIGLSIFLVGWILEIWIFFFPSEIESELNDTPNKKT